MRRKHCPIQVILLALMSEAVLLEALRCKNINTPSDAEMKKIARSCMRKLSDYSTEDSDRMPDSDSKENSSEEHTNVKNFKDPKRDRQGKDRHNFGVDENRRGRYDTRAIQNQRKRDHKSTFEHNRQVERNKACVIHCFFDELNMLNIEEFPDRHKVLYILTKDIQDVDLKNFYTDTIQECFHFLEMERHDDKCDFAKSLVHCMVDYARNNCEDWNEGIMFTQQ